MRQTLLISCVVMVGCVSDPELDPGEAPPSPPPSIEPIFIAGEHEQGQFILGSFPDKLATGGVHYRVSTTPINQPNYRLSVNPAGLNGINGTHLVADDGVAPSPDFSGTDSFFDNLLLSGPNGTMLKIRRSEQIGTSILSTVYFLDYWSVSAAGVGSWVNYCGPRGGGAIPLLGYYDMERTHKLGAFISFACVDGVARKCNTWGYIAGNTLGTYHWEHHQACTGMANANYCGTGKSYTREKTPIVIRDDRPYFGTDAPPNLQHPMSMPGNPDEYYIEAGWLPSGMPLCLSKLRWASLAPNECGPVLPDPRFTNHSEAQFCDKWTVSELFARGAVLVNASKMMDAPLHRWRNPITLDEVSTIRGYFVDRNGDGQADFPGSTEPFTDYTEHLGTEGMLLRNLPGTLAETDMRMLYSQMPTAVDQYLTDLGGGRADPNFEGYAFLNPTTTLTTGETVTAYPLNVCRRGPDHDTVIGNSLGCTFVRNLFHALRAP